MASSWRMAITLAGRGEFGPLPTVTRALEFVAREPASVGFAGRRVVVGSPAAVRPVLEQITAEYGADELMLHTLAHNHAARRRSYELLAKAFGLQGPRGGGRKAQAARRR
jgi:alkanesulfonate monooxygenase SsuD/methylene tetrahydromethanopterin reductase-like flavin-dependent oxidoreductase (luciferase family)